jgi:hypothetical protein
MSGVTFLMAKHAELILRILCTVVLPVKVIIENYNRFVVETSV